MLPRNLLLRKVLLPKVCELIENTFPKVREGDKLSENVWVEGTLRLEYG